MSLFTQRKQDVFAMLSHLDTYPYTLPKQANGISIANAGSGTHIFRCGTLNIPVPGGMAYDADIAPFTVVEHLSGTGDFYVEIRGQ